MNPIVKQFKYGQHTVTLETGAIARQATAAVMASMDDTTVFVTVVAKKDVKEGQDFFPLTVNYQERTYAAGKIPGGFFKREGRPSEGETLIARLIDRPIRPLFPEGFFNEIQVVATVVSVNPQISPDLVAMIGASAALTLSGVPFNGPIGAARVGFIDNQFVLNPTMAEQKQSRLDLVVAGTDKAVLMVESEADILTEEQMLAAVVFGHQQQQVVVEAIKEFAKEAGKPRWDWVAPQPNTDLINKVKAIAEARLGDAYRITEKQARYEQIDAIKADVIAQITTEDEEISEGKIVDIFTALESQIVRGRIIAGEPRIDGRTVDTVRALDICTGVLPRTHGSAIFTRGETQALAVATLGTERDAQIIDELTGERQDHFLFHYNFPPYSVGETGRIGSPKRREIGHGRLAKRSVLAVMPSAEEFPYVVRVVSEITESNGSSSQASICAGTLALMAAGVPIKAPVAGIAMGLISDGTNYTVLTDIQGLEDHLGDMDFKVAGTREGVTALQMDIKIQGITAEILTEALAQAKKARFEILDVIEATIPEVRPELAPTAPKIDTIKIDVDKIKIVIGKGGETIDKIIAETGVKIDIDEEGNVSIYSSDQDAINRTKEIIAGLVREAKVDEVYHAKVVRIEKFGAFVNLFDKTDALVHISEMAWTRTNRVEDLVAIGDEVDVKVIKIDEKGRIDASMKVLLPRPPKPDHDEKGEKSERPHRPRHHKDHRPKKEFTETPKDSE